MQQTIRQQIINDDSVKEIISRLMELPKRLKEASDLLVDAEHEQFTLPFHFGEIEERQEEIKRAVMFEIVNEVNENGKPKYTNESLRQAALMNALSKHPEYIQTKNEMAEYYRRKADVENHIGKARNQMFYVKNQQEVYLAVVHLIAGLCQENITSGSLEKIIKIKNFIEELSHE